MNQKNVGMMGTNESHEPQGITVCTTCISLVRVAWRYWKSMLSPFFKIAPAFHISEYHMFEFSHKTPRFVRARSLTTSIETVTFSLLKPAHKNAACAMAWDE